MNNNTYILEMKKICKTFPGVKALTDVDFNVRPGEVHAIMGENGAGKSTLIKVMTGVHPQDSGQILLDGKPFAPQVPLDAQKSGISTIYQEVDLLPYLTVAENIFIGRQPMKWGRINWKELNHQAADLMQRLGIDVDVTAPLGSYPVAIRQMVSIARAVSFSSRIIVMDEPTSSLDEGEVARLFDIIRKLKAQGIGIVFITHFLDQVYAISDRITVLRNGQQVGVFDTESLPKLELVAHMLGKSPEDVEALFASGEARDYDANKETLMSIKGVSRKGAIQPFDLDIKKGEVLGLAGLLGSGRTEIARLLFGADKPSTGTINLAGKSYSRMTPKRAVNAKIGFSPEDRRTEGIVPDMSVRDNIALAIHKKISPFGFVSRKKQAQIAEKYVKALGIVCSSIEQPIKNLSGGNQQKVILARWLASEPNLLILDEPTRGIDVGAKSEIEALVESLSKKGVSILFISSELEEVVRRCDRIAVLRDRAKIAELSGEECSERNIMNLIAKGAVDAETEN